MKGPSSHNDICLSRQLKPFDKTEMVLFFTNSLNVGISFE